MELINQWLMAIDAAGIRQDVYLTINSIGSYAAYAFGLFHGLKLKVKWWAVVLAVVIERLLAGPLVSAILFVENGFQPADWANAVVMFPLLPLTGLLIAWIVRKPYRQIWDVIMPVPLVMFAFARIACTAAGCCEGYACSWGVYDGGEDCIRFPVQLLQCLATVLILGAMLYREKKNGFVPDGRNMPFLLISYGTARFFLEFLQENEKVFLGCSTTNFYCIAMILMGLWCLRVIKRSESREKEALKCDAIH